MSEKTILRENIQKPAKKKLKLDIESAQKKNLEAIYQTNINDKEIERFLKIFSIIIEQEEETLQAADSEDGVVDILIAIARKITELLRKGIDTLNLPPVLPKTLKALKDLVNLFKLKNTKDKKTA